MSKKSNNFKIGAMYRTLIGFQIFKTPYQESYAWRSANEIGEVINNEVFQLVEVDYVTGGNYSYRILCGYKLGWVSFYNEPAVNNFFVEITE